MILTISEQCDASFLSQNLANLKIISLCGCRNLIEIPDLSNTEKLESVFLHECVSLHQLHHVHAKSLQRLLAYGCSSLKEFSVISEEITELNLGHTAICALLSSIWQKRKLTILSLDNCNNLEFVGINIVHLSSLERLGLSKLTAFLWRQTLLNS